MAEQPKLLGALPSPFTYRVIWALKLKAIPYEFIEEDRTNKSPLLLKNNPVHKKIPVFLHGDKPVCESMIIVQYIDEVWPQNPLLPNDPYERALARFWVNFAEDKGTSVWRMFSSKGEELEKTKKETLEMLQTVEEYGIGEKKFFGGDSIGIADIAFGPVRGIGWLPSLRVAEKLWPDLPDRSSDTDNNGICGVVFSVLPFWTTGLVSILSLYCLRVVFQQSTVRGLSPSLSLVC
ncbi:hypothetical protein SADUNF_Sadunf10G0045800 [Salix dunnii]|uniref:Glutathione S-transferase n=1 Tax=Salix dunnii TaxID=1413687 RepID=A0A835JPQ6_9ROSI|nr:hypothetical protein SADUNF_Sadunf10G0045800 [Salix dunnii]